MVGKFYSRGKLVRRFETRRKEQSRICGGTSVPATVLIAIVFALMFVLTSVVNKTLKEMDKERHLVTLDGKVVQTHEVSVPSHTPLCCEIPKYNGPWAVGRS